MATKTNPTSAPREPASARFKVERERAQFQMLLAENPNYFGNLEASLLKPVKLIASNKNYEEVTCVGFNLNLNALEATVQIKRPTGYKGNLCQAGSTEYVRFYIDYGTGWLDAGIVSFNVHDIPNARDCANQLTKPLSYTLTQQIDPRQRACQTPVLPKVRAILSWEVPPPAGSPNWPPVYGNVLDVHIQLKPREPNILDIVDIIGLNIGQTLELPPEFEEVKLHPIPLPDPPPLALAQLAQMYQTKPVGKQAAAKGATATFVEPHRFGVEPLYAALNAGLTDQSALSAQIQEWQAAGLDWQNALATLVKTKGNVTYEELDCLGLDYNRDWLVATFTVKKPSGYSGDLCGRGSREHVAFWADWNDTCDWAYLGTVSVNVHDIAAIPADGLHYAVILPVNLAPYRQPCSKPKIARVRGVLSWNTPPSTVDPDAIPYWGNRLDTHVQIKPGPIVIGPAPIISILGGIGVAEINILGNGLTKPLARFALTGANADPWLATRECPFGGLIVAQGPPSVGYKYRVWVRRFDTLTSSWTAEVLAKAPIRTVDFNGVGTWRTPDPITGYLAYLDTLQNIDNVLAWWTPGSDDLWEIRVEIATLAEVVLGSTVWHRLQMDNTSPDADIHIDSGGDCKDFTVGSTVSGKFVARDIYFGGYSLSTLPASMSPNSPSPASGTIQTPVAPGSNWTLNTGGMSPMQPCGYVVLLQVSDRAIVNSSPYAHNTRSDDVGFCLRALA